MKTQISLIVMISLPELYEHEDCSTSCLYVIEHVEIALKSLI